MAASFTYYAFGKSVKIDKDSRRDDDIREWLLMNSPRDTDCSVLNYHFFEVMEIIKFLDKHTPLNAVLAESTVDPTTLSKEQVALRAHRVERYVDEEEMNRYASSPKGQYDLWKMCMRC